MKKPTTRTLPLRPIVPPIEGKFIVSSISYEQSYDLREVRVELVSHGEIKFNRLPGHFVTLTEVTQ